MGAWAGPASGTHRDGAGTPGSLRSHGEAGRGPDAERPRPHTQNRPQAVPCPGAPGRPAHPPDRGRPAPSPGTGHLGLPSPRASPFPVWLPQAQLGGPLPLSRPVTGPSSGAGWVGGRQPHLLSTGAGTRATALRGAAAAGSPGPGLPGAGSRWGPGPALPASGDSAWARGLRGLSGARGWPPAVGAGTGRPSRAGPARLLPEA